MKLTKEQQQAYDWAIKQSFPSVAATYARILAGVITQLQNEQNELAKIFARVDVGMRVDPLLTDKERDIVFEAISAIPEAIDEDH